jgi:RNA polymerase sigma-70 factor (ECF subfamily)
MNACIDHRRRRLPAYAVQSDDEPERLANTAEARPGPEAVAYAGELGAMLEAAGGRLPEGQRIVFIMRHHEGLKLCEIAEALGLAEGTVKRQLHTAIHRLRAVLAAANVTVEAGS